MALATDQGDGIKTALSVSISGSPNVVPIVFYGLDHATQVPELALRLSSSPLTFSWLLRRKFTTPFTGDTSGTSQSKIDLGVSTAIIRMAGMFHIHRPADSIKRNIGMETFSGFGSPPNDQVFYGIAAENSAASAVDEVRIVKSGGATFGAGERLAALDIREAVAGNTATAGASDANITVGWDNAESYSLVQIIGHGFNDASEFVEMECSDDGGSSYLTLMDNGTFGMGVSQDFNKTNNTGKFRIGSSTSRPATETFSFMVSIPFPHDTNTYKRVFSRTGGYNPAVSNTRMQPGLQTGATDPAGTDTINHVRFTMSGGANIATGAHIQTLLWP